MHISKSELQKRIKDLYGPIIPPPPTKTTKWYPYKYSHWIVTYFDQLRAGKNYV